MIRSSLRRVAAATIAVASAAVPLAAQQPVSAQASSDPCPVKVAILALRGTNDGGVPEQSYSAGVRSNGFEGSQVSALLWSYADFMNTNWWRGIVTPDTRLRNVPVVAVGPRLAVSTTDASSRVAVSTSTVSGRLAGYQATALQTDDNPPHPLDLGTASWPNSQLWPSAIGGATAAIRQMDLYEASLRQTQPNCPALKWVVVGYSQGAISARLTYAHASNRVVGVFVIADPLQKPTSADQYRSTNVTGVAKHVQKQLPAPYAVWSQWGSNYPVEDYWVHRPVAGGGQTCQPTDPVCDWLNPTHDFGTHVTTYANTFNLDQEGRRLYTIVASALDPNVSPRPAPAEITHDASVLAVACYQTTNCPNDNVFSVKPMATLLSATQLPARAGARYDWDFNGDGDSDDPGEADAGPATSTIFWTWGYHKVAVRIDNGEWITRDVLTVPYSWVFDTSKIPFPAGVTVF
jgi:hypothetical protein